MRTRWDFSACGRGRVALWTVFGTLGCMVAAMLLDSLSFGRLPTAERDRSLLTDIFVTIAVAGPFIFFFASKLRELAIAHYKLAILASTDSLTSVLNRGAFTTLVDAYLKDVRGAERIADGALLVIDVDHFKRINDSFGHDRGDEALQLIAQAIKGVLRGHDLVGRMGGEEFGVFLPATNPRNAEIAAERIRQAINELDFLPDGSRRPLSVSVGGASFADRVPFTALYREADRRLYEAKGLGRNRVAFSAMTAGLPQAA
jgi:diguanylate cyclase